MTVNELIQQLQEIPDGLKNCEVVMRQYNGCCKYAVSVDNVKIGKSIKVGDLSFEGLELATSKAVVVCSIKMTRNAQLAAQAATEEEEA